MLILHTLGQLAGNLLTLVLELIQLVGTYAQWIVWIAWWLGGVNWKKAWPVLGRGAWLPVVLLTLLTAQVWASISPDRMWELPSFWGHLAYVTVLVGIAFFCGWLQGVFHWTPAEISLDPPAHGHGHDHAHGHDHHHAETSHAPAGGHESHGLGH